MSETLPGYSAYTKGSPEPPTPQEVIERQRVRILELLKVLECVAGMPCICQEGDDGFPAGFHVRSCVVGVAQKLLGRTQDER